jgi:hypothetical protein
VNPCFTAVPRPSAFLCFCCRLTLLGREICDGELCDSGPCDGGPGDSGPCDDWPCDLICHVQGPGRTLTRHYRKAISRTCWPSRRRRNWPSSPPARCRLRTSTPRWTISMKLCGFSRNRAPGPGTAIRGCHIGGRFIFEECSRWFFHRCSALFAPVVPGSLCPFSTGFPRALCPFSTGRVGLVEASDRQNAWSDVLGGSWGKG